MNQLIAFLLASIIWSNHAVAQNEKIELKFSDFDKLFSQAKIIGAGESTHGTAEFTETRLSLFKHLVENQGYTIFFLEADFSACQRVNRYIQGEEDSVQQALSEIRLWPWLTHEMIALIEWCKEYNVTHPHALSFVGCDMQMVYDDYTELNRRLNSSYSETLDSIFMDLNYTASAGFLEQRAKRWKALQDELAQKEQAIVESIDYTMLSNSVDQWFTNVLNGSKHYNFRDSCMATNMLHYLDKFPDSKSLYFAHNWHVSNTIYTYKTSYATRTTGAFLKEKLGTEYVPIALLAYDLEFNALSCRHRKTQMNIFHLYIKNRKYLEAYFYKNVANKSLMYQATEIDNLEKYKIKDIGGIYGKDCKGLTYASERKLKKEMFEVFIYIPKGKPTHLIEVIHKK